MKGPENAFSDLGMLSWTAFTDLSNGFIDFVIALTRYLHAIAGLVKSERAL